MNCRLARSLARSAPAGRRLGLPPSFAQLSRLCPVKPGKPASPGTGPGENLSFRISGNTCPPTCPRRDQRAQLPASPARHDLISDETERRSVGRWSSRGKQKGLDMADQFFHKYATIADTRGFQTAGGVKTFGPINSAVDG